MPLLAAPLWFVVGRVPIGATPVEATGVVETLWERGGEPPGDDADVRLD